MFFAFGVQCVHCAIELPTLQAGHTLDREQNFRKKFAFRRSKRYQDVLYLGLRDLSSVLLRAEEKFQSHFR